MGEPEAVDGGTGAGDHGGHQTLSALIDARSV